MPTYFQKPENALKRANEFIDVGKKERALESLYDVIKSKKHRTWQVTHEPIMEQYLELCVELRKSNIAKEGLYQYKIICQAVNINSLVMVVRKYIKMAEDKTEEARLKSKASVLDVDDLDAPESPESILMKVVSGEDTQARADRTHLMPWVKFLWESYRQCLELLRNNSRIESLYQDIAQQAFRFCLKYSRSTEFRKLCDNLRNHLQLVYRHQHPQTAINLNNPDSQAMHLETRLAQLDSAIKMELWQEAFKAVEDIHSLIALSKKSPKPSLMANYYQKLSLVFWKSASYVFHAAALHRLFHLQREQRKNITPAELQQMAAKVLCATLAIPMEPAKNAIDRVLELDETTMKKERHLATLLMLNGPPTRKTLLNDVVNNGVLGYLSPELQKLYSYIEVEYHPLTLTTLLKPSMDYISADDNLAQYSESLEDVIIARLVKQVSQVYQSIKFTRLMTLLPFATNYRLERVIVRFAKILEMQIRIDHSTESITFGTDLLVSQREDVEEGPHIQSMPSETIRNQLTVMAKALRRAIDTIEPRQSKPEHIKMKEMIVNCYKASSQKDHSRLLQRRQIIEERKEQLETYNTRKEEEEQKQEEDKRRKIENAEKVRRESEAQHREKQRLIDEHENIRRRHAQDKMKELRQSEIGAKVLQTMDESEFEALTVEDIMEKQVEQIEKDRKVQIEKLKSQEKKIDYMTRAKRLVEIPLMQEDYEKNRVLNREAWDKQEEERVAALVLEKEMSLKTRSRLELMMEDKDAFMKQLRDSRKTTFKDKVAEFEKSLAEERKKRLEDRKKKRKEDRRTTWLRGKEEAEQTKRDEELKREREEEEENMREMREQEEQEFAMMKAQDDELEERKKRKEQEPAPGGKWQAGVPHSGGWRERVQAHNAAWSAQGSDRRPQEDQRPTDDRRPPEDRRPADTDKPSWRSDRIPTETSLPTRDWRDDRGQPDKPLPRQDDRSDWRSPGDRPRDDRKPDDRPPANSWRDEQPKAWGRDTRDTRDERPSTRDDRPVSRDDRPPMRDERDSRAAPARTWGPSRDGPRDEPSRDGPARAWGPSRDGPRDGPSRDGPSRDMSSRDAPARAWGPSRDGSSRDGPPRDGPRTWGPSRDTPSSDGYSRDAPYRDGPSRDGSRAWGPSRDGSSRDAPPPRDDNPARDDKPRAWGRDDRAGPRSWGDRSRDEQRDERPPARDDGPPRRGGMDRDDRPDDRREPDRYERRDEREPMRSDRGPPQRDDRGPPSRDNRGPPPRDDRDPPPRDDRRPMRDERPPARDWRGEPTPSRDAWRRDDVQSDDRWRRDERPDERRDDRRQDDRRPDDRGRYDAPRDSPRDEPLRAGGDWRRDGPGTQSGYQDERRTPMKDVDNRDWKRDGPDSRGAPEPRGGQRDERRDDWKRGENRPQAPVKDVRRNESAHGETEKQEDDGWTTVRH